jgi:hypothetical protein
MRFAKRLLNAMPAAESSYAAHIRPLASPPKIVPTADVPGLQAIADKHITKGLGRLKDHVFKEGKGLRVLTTVRSTRIPPRWHRCWRGPKREGGADTRTARSCWTSRPGSE